jgi:two-component system, NarL family, invasion response regulator UvrY
MNESGKKEGRETKLKILIADDHAVVREGLKVILRREFPDAEFRVASTKQETLDLVREGQFNLLVLDLFMPDGNGFDVLQEVRLTQPRLAVLVFSSASEEQLGIRMLRAGSSGYLDKCSASESLGQAARKVLSGGKYVSPHLAELFALEADHGQTHLHESLSFRELQVLRLVVGGQCLKAIAADLTLSVKTVRTYRARLLGKLHLQSDVDLVHYALDHHLVEKSIAP